MQAATLHRAMSIVSIYLIGDYMPTNGTNGEKRTAGGKFKDGNRPWNFGMTRAQMQSYRQMRNRVDKEEEGEPIDEIDGLDEGILEKIGRMLFGR